MPVFPGGSTYISGGLIFTNDFYPLDAHMQHQAWEITCQKDIAAAAQHQPRQGSQHGILPHLLQLRWVGDRKVGLRTRRYPEGIQVAQGIMVLYGQRLSHSGRL